MAKNNTKKPDPRKQPPPQSSLLRAFLSLQPGIPDRFEFDMGEKEMAEEAVRLRKLRDRLRAGLEAKLDEVFINGSMEHRLPNNLNMSFAYVEGESLLMGINDIAVSSGSACTSATLEPSYVLKALGVGEDLAHTSIRFGLGRFNTEEEVDYVTDKMVTVVKKLRELSPLYEMAKEGIDISKMNWQTA